MLETPVLLILFNRPDTTARVFEAIRQAQPTWLFIAADGPRNDAETALTNAARNVTEKVDWPCAVVRHYAAENMGCKMRPYTAISWAFEQCEELIILEDDCLPHPDFFGFVSGMLDKYRSQEKVMHISGDCFLPFKLKESYYFTRYTHVWGWATWRRAWASMDIEMKDWIKLKSVGFPSKYLEHKKSSLYWSGIFDYVANEEISIWDYQWTYSVWKSGGLSIAPTVNLISNIGFGTNATHTMNAQSAIGNLPTCAMPLIISPVEIVVNEKADAWIRDNIYLGPSRLSIKQILHNIKRRFRNA